jgi:hypothetical protein
MTADPASLALAAYNPRRAGNPSADPRPTLADEEFPHVIHHVI